MAPHIQLDESRTLPIRPIICRMLDTSAITILTRIYCFVNHCLNALQEWIFSDSLLFFHKRYSGKTELKCVPPEPQQGQAIQLDFMLECSRQLIHVLLLLIA